MSQQLPSAADPASPISSVNEEIEFQQVLLLSLDDSLEDQSTLRKEVETQIAKLVSEKIHLTKLQAASPSAIDQTPPFSHNNSNALLSGIGRSRMKNNLGRGSNGADGYQFKEESGSIEFLSSTVSTPGFGASTAQFPGLTKVNLPTRKRSHSNHLDPFVSFEENKSRRTTPSPFTTGVKTPSGSSSLWINEEMSDPSYNEANYMGGMNKMFKKSISDTSFGHPHQNGSSPSNNLNTKSTTTNIPGAFPEDASQDSDSDIEIIDPSAFKDNGRQKITASRKANTNGYQKPSYPGVALALGDSAIRRTDTSLAHSLYGGNYTLPNCQATSTNAMDDPSMLNGDMSAVSALDIDSTTGLNNTSKLGGSNNNFPPWYQGLPPSNFQHGMNSVQSGFSMDNLSSADSLYQNSNDSGVFDSGYPHSSMTLQNQSYTLPGSYEGSMHSAHPGTSMHNAGSGCTLDNVPKSAMTQAYADSLDNTTLWPRRPAYANYLRQGMYDNMNTSSDIMPTLTLFSRPEEMKLSTEMMGRMEDIINDPRKTEKEIKDLLDNIKADIEIPLENREGTPEGLKYPLYEHQKIALSWLKQMEEGTNKGGILADDMGLGKTISTLALLLARPSADCTCKTTLLAAPVALLRQWQSEISMKVLAQHRPSVYMAHGNSKKVTWDELRQFDIILTTYGTLSAEYTRILKFEEDCKEKGIVYPDAKQMAIDFPFLGPRSRFYRVILDEAQCIKNKTTKAAGAAYRLKALTRVCLTGTPMMNGIIELYSLIKFLRIRPYNSWPSFSREFGCLSKGGRHSEKHIDNAMQRLQGVLKAILLRRTKKSQIDGKPIISLPPKVEEIAHVVFSNDEQEYYQSLEGKTRLQFNKYKKAGTVGKNYSNILVLLLRLRQCCCHPHLIIDFEAEAPPAGSDELTEQEMIKLAKTLDPDVVSRILNAGGFECNICYDVTPNPSIITPCGHDNCHDCLSSLTDSATQAAQAQGNDGAVAIKCPSCRGKLDMTKLIDYRAFKKAHLPLSEVEENDMDDFGDDDDNTDSDSDSDSDSDVDENGNLNGFIVPDDVVDDESGQGDDQVDNLGMEPSTSQSKSKSKIKTKDRSKKGKGKGKEKKVEKQHLSIAMMKKDASRSIEGHKKYMRYLRKNWQSSAKADKCVELLEKFQAEGEKTIIFSQFVTFLDLLQVPIADKGWQFERYDGSINSKRRNDAIQRFTTRNDCKIMLISLKAGNAGLNLVAASRVIILDPFWNPFIEMQAVDRAYRIGQQKPVQVHRILVRGTVEDRIIQLQDKKRALVDSALDEGAMKSVGRLDERQLAFLFGVN